MKLSKLASVYDELQAAKGEPQRIHILEKLFNQEATLQTILLTKLQGQGPVLCPRHFTNTRAEDLSLPLHLSNHVPLTVADLR